MTSFRQVSAEYVNPPVSSAQELCMLGGNGSSLAEAISKISDENTLDWIAGGIVRQVKNLFRGGTSEADEDRALELILSIPRARQMINSLNAITWDALDDELDEADLTQIIRRAQDLLDTRDYVVGSLLKYYFLADLDEVVSFPAVRLSTPPSYGFAADYGQDVLARSSEITAGLGRRALRGIPTGIIEFRTVLQVISQTLPRKADDLATLSWNAFYTEQICSQLAAGRYKLLLQMLPEMFKNGGDFPSQRGPALFNMLRQWDSAFEAMRVVIDEIGTVEQKASMARFMDTKRAAMSKFPGPNAAPGLIAKAIAEVVAAIGEVGNTIEDLIKAIQNISDSIANFQAQGVLGKGMSGQAVSLTNRLSSEKKLAILPVSFKSELMARLLNDGWVEDEEEQAVLTILRDTKELGIAEFLQLAGSATWETLDDRFNGTEYEQLEDLFHL